jgi:hypothetical protein
MSAAGSGDISDLVNSVGPNIREEICKLVCEAHAEPPERAEQHLGGEIRSANDGYRAWIHAAWPSISHGCQPIARKIPAANSKNNRRRVGAATDAPAPRKRTQSSITTDALTALARMLQCRGQTKEIVLLAAKSRWQ